MTIRGLMWKEIAYLCRYAKQPISEVLRLSKRDRSDFLNAVEFWIKQEFDTKK